MRKIEDHRIVALLGLIALAGAVINGLVYSHAWSMLHFVPEGQRTKLPEQLSWHEKLHVLIVGVNLPHPKNDRLPGDMSLSYTTHRFWTGDRIQLEGWWIPHERAQGVVMLFHGYASTKSSLLEEAAAFGDFGMSCFLVDHRGHGGSAGDYTSIGYREAGDVIAAADFVRSRLQDTSPIVLYGQSMGGVSIFRALSTSPIDARGVIVEGIYDETVNAVKNRFKAMGLPPFPGAELLCFWGGAQMGFSARSHNPVQYARAIKTPVLILQGEGDLRATPEQAQRVFAHLGGRKAFVAIPGAKHESLYKRSPTLWKKEVGSFLGSALGQKTSKETSVQEP